MREKRAQDWLTFLPLPLFSFGLVSLYIGERSFDGVARAIVSGAGVLLAISGLAVAAARLSSEQPERRRAAGQLFVEYALVVLAVVLYFLQTDLVGLVPAGRMQTILQVVWPALLALGLLPAVAMELALWSMVRSPKLELWRVRFAGRSARIVGLALVAFAGVNFAASKWNRKIDLSYFKTTKPGTSTKALIDNATTPVRFVLFFPPSNQVAEQAQDYLRSLTKDNELATLEAVDQALEPELARELNVRSNGYLAMTANERSETLRLGDDIEDARNTLRDLDTKVQERLIKVLRPPRVAYFTTGHMERDYARVADDTRLGMRSLRQLLETLGFRVKRLGLGEGLGNQIPEDATLLIVAGPLEPFLPEERAAIERYMKSGGRMLALMDPDTGITGDELLAPLGVEVSSALVANDRYLVRVEGSGESPYNLVTVRAGNHPSAQTLARAGGRLAVYLIGSGAVRALENPSEKTKVEPTLKAMAKSWLDENGNRQQDEGEKDSGLSFAMAIERSSGADKDGKSTPPMRALVFGDADLAADGVLANPGNALFVSDVVRWLAGDDEVVGTVESEKDVPIVHRKDEDAIWFYGTSFLIPAGVLGVGLLISRSRRPRRRPEQ